MPKKIYVGVNDTARNVKKIYVGVNDVARKIKKIYVGVNDIARLVYENEMKMFTITVTGSDLNSLCSIVAGRDLLREGNVVTYPEGTVIQCSAHASRKNSVWYNGTNVGSEYSFELTSNVKIVVFSSGTRTAKITITTEN